MSTGYWLRANYRTMGSLMAGWSSPFRDPELAKFQRNKSLTRGEIDAYRRSTSKNEEEEQLTGDVSLVQGKGETVPERSSSSRPLRGSWDSILNYNFEPDADGIFVGTNRWWTRSASAFLNEPPVTAMDGPSYKYAAQWLRSAE